MRLDKLQLELERSEGHHITAFQIPDQEEWKIDAACQDIDPELFFPDKSQAGRAAKAVCGRCVVRKECLEYALKMPSSMAGIWGGTTPNERAQMRRRG